MVTARAVPSKGSHMWAYIGVPDALLDIGTLFCEIKYENKRNFFGRVTTFFVVKIKTNFYHKKCCHTTKKMKTQKSQINTGKLLFSREGIIMMPVDG